MPPPLRADSVTVLPAGPASLPEIVTAWPKASEWGSAAIVSAGFSAWETS